MKTLNIPYNLKKKLRQEQMQQKMRRMLQTGMASAKSDELAFEVHTSHIFLHASEWVAEPVVSTSLTITDWTRGLQCAESRFYPNKAKDTLA